MRWEGGDTNYYTYNMMMTMMKMIDEQNGDSKLRMERERED